MSFSVDDAPGTSQSMVEEAPFEPAVYVLHTSSVRSSGSADWKVEVRADGHRIIRHIWHNGTPWNPSGEECEPEQVIWPTWPTGPEAKEGRPSPLAGLQKDWSRAGNRLRDSAKWMATVLGAALAAVVGTSPLGVLQQHRLHAPAVALAAAGFVLLGLTLFLILQVMRPHAVSYSDVQNAQQKHHWRLLPDSLLKWKHNVESQQDLYLPRGISSLVSLRQAMIIEEATLMALARAKATSRSQDASQKLCDAEDARAAWLAELRDAAATITAVGEYYKLRERSTWATYSGVTSGVLGTMALVAAFSWPFG